MEELARILLNGGKNWHYLGLLLLLISKDLQNNMPKTKNVLSPLNQTTKTNFLSTQ